MLEIIENGFPAFRAMIFYSLEILLDKNHLSNTMGGIMIGVIDRKRRMLYQAHNKVLGIFHVGFIDNVQRDGL